MNSLHHPSRKFQIKSKDECPFCNRKLFPMLDKIAKSQGNNFQGFRMQIALKLFNAFWDFKKNMPRGADERSL